jgi:pyridoxine kinase
VIADHNHQKKIALINDLSGFGRCSIAVSLPIISQMRIQCCPLPTSILSNHTGFDSFFFDDYTDNMQPYIAEWKKLDLHFSGICSGFLGSKKQIDIVIDFFKEFTGPDTLVVVDPVMGDYGTPYSTYTPEMCAEMKQLVTYADIVTPNLTEGCILTGMEYKKDERWTIPYVTEMAERLSEMGPSHVVITGIPQGSFIANLCYTRGGTVSICRTKRIGAQRSGTGDIFSSIIAADAVNGVPFEASVKKASQFIKKCIKRSIELDIPLTDGVCFEEVLYTLR